MDKSYQEIEDCISRTNMHKPEYATQLVKKRLRCRLYRNSLKEDCKVSNSARFENHEPRFNTILP